MIRGSLSVIALTLIIIATVCASVKASPGTTLIHGVIKLPESPQKNLPPKINSTLLTLNDGEFTTYSTAEGTFQFHSVPPGVHVLNVHSQLFHFSQIKIQILPSENDQLQQPRCIEYVYPGAPKQNAPYPIILTAHAQYDYFEPKPSLSIFKIFKSPMVMLMIFSAGMMFVMPQMMKNMDPEQKQQMKKNMEMQQDPTKMLSQLWGDLSGAGDGANVKEVSEKKVIKKSARLKRE